MSRVPHVANAAGAVSHGAIVERLSDRVSSLGKTAAVGLAKRVASALVLRLQRSPASALRRLKQRWKRRRQTLRHERRCNQPAVRVKNRLAVVVEGLHEGIALSTPANL
jgi:hypothetical protein